MVTAPSATHLYCMRFLQRRGALKIAPEVSEWRWWYERQVHMEACSYKGYSNEGLQPSTEGLGGSSFSCMLVLPVTLA